MNKQQLHDQALDLITQLPIASVGYERETVEEADEDGFTIKNPTGAATLQVALDDRAEGRDQATSLLISSMPSGKVTNITNRVGRYFSVSIYFRDEAKARAVCMAFLPARAK